MQDFSIYPSYIQASPKNTNWSNTWSREINKIKWDYDTNYDVRYLIQKLNLLKEARGSINTQTIYSKFHPKPIRALIQYQ